VLKPGGRFAISDVRRSREVRPTCARTWSYGSGAWAGALEEKEFISLLSAAGFENSSHRSPRAFYETKDAGRVPRPRTRTSRMSRRASDTRLQNRRERNSLIEAAMCVSARIKASPPTTKRMLRAALDWLAADGISWHQLHSSRPSESGAFRAYATGFPFTARFGGGETRGQQRRRLADDQSR